MAAQLRTERLELTPFAPTHVAALHALWTDPAVRRYLWDGRVIPRETTVAIVERSAVDFREFGAGFWVVAEQAAPETVVGFCGYRRFEEGDVPELLFGIVPAVWGRGYVTEAGHAVLRHGFEVCGFERVVAATDTPNQPSVAVLRRLGMVFERRREYHGLDTVFYALTPEDWADHLALEDSS